MPGPRWWVAVGLMTGVAALGEAPQPPIVQQVTQAGARAYALGEFCTAQNRGAVRTFAAALAGWQQRNRWAVVQTYQATDPALKASYEAAVTASLGTLRQHAFKSAIACGLMDGVLRQAEWDPSVQHRAEISGLREASGPAAGGSAGAAKASGAEPGGAGSGSGSAGISEAASAVQDGPGATPVAAGERVTVGAGSFAVPAGWTVLKSTPELAMLARDEERGRGRTLLVVTSVPLAGDLRSTAFAAFRSQFPGTGLEFKNFRDGTTGAGLPAVYGGDVGKLRTGGTGVIRAVAVRVGDRVETVLMLLPPTALVQIPRQKEMEALVAGMTFAGAGGAAAWSPLRPPAGYGGLRGLWMGTRMQNQLNPLGGMDLLAIREYAVLFPDGRAYFGLPKAGRVLDMDFAAACAAEPKSCGLYRLAGGQMTVERQGDYGMVTRETVRAEGEGGAVSFAAGGATLSEVRPVKGLRLEGSFTATSGMSGSTAGQTTGLFSQTYLRLRADGTFEKSGFTTASFSNSGAAGTVNSRRGVERGQYTLDGFTLTLQPEGGATEVYTALVPDGSAGAKAIFVDDRAFLREGR